MIDEIHEKAIDTSEDTGKAVAKADTEYRKQLAIQTAMAKLEYGSTISETMARGHSSVLEAKEALAVAEVKDRAAMERIRLCRDSRRASYE